MTSGERGLGWQGIMAYSQVCCKRLGLLGLAQGPGLVLGRGM